MELVDGHWVRVDGLGKRGSMRERMRLLGEWGSPGNSEMKGREDVMSSHPVSMLTMSEVF